MASTQKIWVITGTSTGLGRELALAALSRGDKVVATARSIDRLKDLRDAHPEHCSTLQLNVDDPFEVLSAKAKEASAVWGKMDVLVNNAGYSVVGTIEESGANGLMRQYKTNVFGAINVTNAFLPHMRNRRSGTVVFIGSRSGWRTNMATNGIYGSSKAAIHAIADSLAEELRPLNIRVLNIVPGGLRTDNIDHIHAIPGSYLAHPMPSVEQGEVPEYAEIRRLINGYLTQTNGSQTGDPRKAAKVIVDAVRDEGSAAGKVLDGTLFLGSDAVRDVKAKCESILKNLEEWGDVSRSIDL